MKKNKELGKSAKSARESVLQALAKKISEKKQTIENGLNKVEEVMIDYAPDEVRFLAMAVLSNIVDGVVILDGQKDGKHSVVAACSKSAVTAGFNAANIIKEIAQKHNGSGGGRPEFAMGGYMS